MQCDKATLGKVAAKRNRPDIAIQQPEQGRNWSAAIQLCQRCFVQRDLQSQRDLCPGIASGAARANARCIRFERQTESRRDLDRYETRRSRTFCVLESCFVATLRQMLAVGVAVAKLTGLIKGLPPQQMRSTKLETPAQHSRINTVPTDRHLYHTCNI